MLGFTVPRRLHRSFSYHEVRRLCTPAVSLGSTDTLIQHPAALTHGVVAEDVKEALGISPGFLRISVGLEDPRDLITDLEQALERPINIKLHWTQNPELPDQQVLQGFGRPWCR